MFTSKLHHFLLLHLPLPLRRHFLSTCSTPYPLYYELVNYRPPRSSRRRLPSSATADISSSNNNKEDLEESNGDTEPMDRVKRRYYRKREKRMYGGTAADDDSSNSKDEGFVELKPEIVDFPRLHAREEELYFYDAFAFPWEKDKHYRMVYQLEKKYFPEQSLDKAFVDPDSTETPIVKKKKKAGVKGKDTGKSGIDEAERDERGLVFFDDEKEKEKEKVKTVSGFGDVAPRSDVMERKVEDLFKCLKKVPSRASGKKSAVVGLEEGEREPYLMMQKTELPPRWDGPSGTVVLIDKPKGWTSFTVCGKLRRLVKVQKVGHAGTLDPMATGLLIVCVGKATKLVERYQDMVKGYSGVFRLGEATSTLDADSPVIQREPWEHITDDNIKRAVESFLGEIWQVPPMFSAIKVGGEKMYEKARRGENIELSPRRISIFQFDVERSMEDRQNLLFRVTCSKGTYIRSLCADLGKALGSCAHLTALRRDSIGEYSVNEAWEFQELQDQITHQGIFLKWCCSGRSLVEPVCIGILAKCPSNAPDWNSKFFFLLQLLI